MMFKTRSILGTCLEETNPTTIDIANIMAKKKTISKQFKYLFTNFKLYFTLYIGVLSGLGLILSIVACIIDFAGLFKDLEIGVKILIVLGVYLVLALLTIPLFFTKKAITYYKNGEFEISAEYGDIDKISSKRGDKKIIVIMVNTTFDMIVEGPGPKALVAGNTNHGRFADRVCREKKITYEQLNDEVQNLLSNNKNLSYKLIDRERGNKKEYPLGTTVIYDLGKISYLLFAFSHFDDNNNAHPVIDNLPLDKIMDEINKYSQNLDVYIPLIGTGQSDYKLSNSESFCQMKHYFLSHIDRVEAKYRILVYKGIKDEVSIFKNC